MVIFVKFKSINVLLEVKGLLNKKSSAFFFSCCSEWNEAILQSWTLFSQLKTPLPTRLEKQDGQESSHEAFSNMLFYNPNQLIYISIYIYPTVLYSID